MIHLLKRWQYPMAPTVAAPRLPSDWQSGELQPCHLSSTDKAAIFSHKF
jgi:hypothetical protein